jgi:hypothetical protein
VPSFPNVPFVPGVPPVARPPGFVPSVLSLLVNDTVSAVLTGLYALQWGIFKNGIPILVPLGSNILNASTAVGGVVSNLTTLGRLTGTSGLIGLGGVTGARSIISLDFKKDATVSSYPVEQGGFQSYNKVQTPFEARVRIASGPSKTDRSNLLTTVEALYQSLDTYDVATPEANYSSANVHHYDYQRTATNGAGLIVVDLWLTQIVQTSTSTFANTQTPSGANPIAGGNVQPVNSAVLPGTALPLPTAIFH